MRAESCRAKSPVAAEKVTPFHSRLCEIPEAPAPVSAACEERGCGSGGPNGESAGRATYVLRRRHPLSGRAACSKPAGSASPCRRRGACKRRADSLRVPSRSYHLAPARRLFRVSAPSNKPINTHRRKPAPLGRGRASPQHPDSESSLLERLSFRPAFSDSRHARRSPPLEASANLRREPPPTPLPQPRTSRASGFAPAARSAPAAPALPNTAARCRGAWPCGAGGERVVRSQEGGAYGGKRPR